MNDPNAAPTVRSFHLTMRDGVRIEILMEWVLHALTSYLIAPSRVAPSEDEMRELLETMLLPAVLAPTAREARVKTRKE